MIMLATTKLIQTQENMFYFNEYWPLDVAYHHLTTIVWHVPLKRGAHTNTTDKFTTR